MGLTAYRPSSPFAGYGGGSKPTTGDYHYWEVWHGRKPISEYNRVRTRFFSEYGMQSFPEFESVRRFAPDEKDWDIHSEVMMWHQRGGAHATSLIETYLESEYKKPGRFQDLLYVGQLMQGDAMRTAVEAHRRDKGYCWGTLLWQINDCWPVASWSTPISFQRLRILSNEVVSRLYSESCFPGGLVLPPTHFVGYSEYSRILRIYIGSLYFSIFSIFHDVGRR